MAENGVRRRRAPAPPRSVFVAVAALVIAFAGPAALLTRPAGAADHLDPPGRTDVGANSDIAADIADVFIWNTGATVTIAVTGAGPRDAGIPATYDRNVLNRYHISNDGNPATDEFVIDVRFGRDGVGNWGVQFTGVPGASGPMSGPVQTILTDPSGAKAIAGLFDDPFFFDLIGFRATRSTGALQIRNDRNFFAGKNDTVYVAEFPRAAVENGAFPITAWAETRRIAGAP